MILYPDSKHLMTPTDESSMSIEFSDGGVSLKNPPLLIRRMFYFWLSKKGHLLESPRFQSTWKPSKS